LYVAFFGEVSTGKSSLIQALSGVESAIDVVAGTTTSVHLVQALLPSGVPVMLADVPGSNELGGNAHAALARSEALRAHLVALVVSGDLTRSEAADWQWLSAFGKPMWLILNKADRYSANERAHLIERLQEKFGAPAIAVSAGYLQAVTVIDVDGHEQQRTRYRPPQLSALTARLEVFAHSVKASLEPARTQAVLTALDLKLTEAEHQKRLVTGQALVRQYTHRAVIGALAAIAPGSDLVIQGALAIGLIHGLCELYGIKISKLEIDDLLKLIGGRIKGSIALSLAIAGNAAKAFPGVGTLGGGALHAIAYGLLFERIGCALLECLDKQLLDARGGVDRLALLTKLEHGFRNHYELIAQAKEISKTILQRD
jgi:uncharacterized protein